MKTGERVDYGLTLIKEERWDEVSDYIRATKQDDPLASELIEVALSVYRYASPDAIRKGRRLLSRVSDAPELATRLFNWLGTAHRMMGELETAENYFLRALEIDEGLGEIRFISATKLNLLLNRFFAADYASLRQELPGFIRSATPANAYWGRCLQVMLDVFSGDLLAARRNLNAILRKSSGLYRYGARELDAALLRLEGRLEDSVNLYLELTENFLRFESPYAGITCAKALEIIRLKGLGLPSSGLIKKCLRTAKKGSWGEQAAAREIEALLEPDDASAAAGALESAEGYKRASLPWESFVAGLTSAYLAWTSDAPIFPKALRFLGPLAPLYPGMKQDPIFGDFLRKAEPLLGAYASGRGVARIKAWLIEGPRILVDQKEILLEKWYNKKAARAFLYLLLSPRHRIQADHLFYLLWPRRKFSARNKELLYVAIYNIRKAIGDSGLLTKRMDYYQLEDVWTDLDEMEELTRLSDANGDESKRAEMIARAREIARGELLPDIIDDRYIEEYRLHFARLKKRLSELRL
ncbi:MAG: hypothetical protein ABIN66_02185 [candidate division WOR-3 bacterium]